MTSADNKVNKNFLSLIDLEEKNIIILSKGLEKLYDIWDKVGVDEEQQVNRASQVWGYIFDTLKDISEEEKTLCEDIIERVRNYEIKLLALSEELLLPKQEEVLGTLIHKEETLRQKVDELSKIKHNRLREHQELLSLEKKYCKVLGMPPLNISSTTGVPTEKDLEELRQQVNMLKEERAHRQKKFYSLKKELTTILEVTELTPETPLELEILTSKEDDLTLSNDTFKVLEEFVTKTKNKKTQLENEKCALMEKLNILWDVLKVTKDDREKFLSKYTCCRVSSIKAIKEEIARCEELKRQNIQQYVEALKDELQSLLDKCFVSNSLLLLSHFQTDEVDEALLQSYDNEVAKWRKYYKETEHIIQKILKRQELWNLMTVFENKANDPNRFKNRGGNLLQEERERKKLQKKLPALENEIFLEIDNYEESTGKKFLYFGENFKEFITKQWDDRIAQKENEKKMRQQQRSQENEPNSTKRTFSSTPKSAPSKLFKSSHGLAIYRTPNYSTLKQVPATTAKMKANKLLVLRSGGSNKKTERNILKEKCMNKAEASSSHDSTTYTDFAEKLNRSRSSHLRSSVLSSKKIVGTRISTSKSKRKSGNTSTRKSSRKQTNTSVNKKSNSSKLTPARGKLGLPFLI